MNGANQDRLAELLMRQRRSNRIPAVVEAWSSIGVAVSPLSDQGHRELVARLRISRRWSFRLAASLQQPMGDFVRSLDTVIVVDQDVNEHPALLAPTTALVRSEHRLRTIYPNGFLLIDQTLISALIVDFDDHRVEVGIDQVELASIA